MSFPSSSQTPRTQLILCFVLSAMLLHTFIFLLSLVITALSWSSSCFHSLPSQCFLLSSPLLAVCHLSPLSFLQMVDIDFPFSYPGLMLDSAPTPLHPRVRRLTSNSTSSQTKLQNSEPEQSHPAQYVWVWCNPSQMERPETPSS